MKPSSTRQLFGTLRKSSDILSGIPVFELVGDHRALIENHNGVIEYGSERICVKVRYGKLCICGFDMELAKMTNDQLVISGTIQSILIKRKGEL